MVGLSNGTAAIRAKIIHSFISIAPPQVHYYSEVDWNYGSIQTNYGSIQLKLSLINLFFSFARTCIRHRTGLSPRGPHAKFKGDLFSPSHFSSRSHTPFPERYSHL